MDSKFEEKTMKNRAPIAILDSGSGGLTVWREIVRLLPFESVIYYADSANCPYGTRDYNEIRLLTRACVEELIGRGVKMVVIACNTMTAAAISWLRQSYPDMLFVGMEPAVKPAAELSRSGVIGILATRATLDGEIYRNTLKVIDPNITIIERAGTGLVEFVEQEMEDSTECEELTRSYIEPMIDHGADYIVLGCTHYPFLKRTINIISQGRAEILDPAPAISRRVKSLLEREALLNDSLSHSDVRHVFISSSGSERSDHLCRRAESLL